MFKCIRITSRTEKKRRTKGNKVKVKKWIYQHEKGKKNGPRPLEAFLDSMFIKHTGDEISWPGLYLNVITLSLSLKTEDRDQ